MHEKQYNEPPASDKEAHSKMTLAGAVLYRRKILFMYGNS